MIIYYKCPRCFCQWQKEVEEFNVCFPDEIECLCEYCEDPSRTELQILHRMIEKMSSSSVFNFPKIMKKMMNHVVFKE